MNAADLTALRELHRLISRSFSVHAAYAPALERAIVELMLNDPELPGYLAAKEAAGLPNPEDGSWLSCALKFVESLDRPRMLPVVEAGAPAPAGSHFERHGDKLVFRSPLPYAQFDPLAAKARPSIEERNAAHQAKVLFGQATATEHITLAPGETFRNITNAGKVPFAIPAHWPLPLDLDE